MNNIISKKFDELENMFDYTSDEFLAAYILECKSIKMPFSEAKMKIKKIRTLVNTRGIEDMFYA